MKDNNNSIPFSETLSLKEIQCMPELSYMSTPQLLQYLETNKVKSYKLDGQFDGQIRFNKKQIIELTVHL